MRQQFDWVRAVDESTLVKLSDKGKRLLGINVRMPCNVNEFYLPSEKRLYKADQG